MCRQTVSRGLCVGPLLTVGFTLVTLPSRTRSCWPYEGAVGALLEGNSLENMIDRLQEDVVRQEESRGGGISSAVREAASPRRK